MTGPSTERHSSPIKFDHNYGRHVRILWALRDNQEEVWPVEPPLSDEVAYIPGLVTETVEPTQSHQRPYDWEVDG